MKVGDVVQGKITHNFYVVIEVKGKLIKLRSERGMLVEHPTTTDSYVTASMSFGGPVGQFQRR